MHTKKVLFISDKLEHYRIPLFNLIADKVDLTIAHADQTQPNTVFKQEKLSIQHKGPFIYYKVGSLDKYDVVIYPFNARVINLFLESFKKTNYKKGIFGIGVAASYTKSYDQKTLLDYLRVFYLKKFDFAIFYENYPLIKYKALGIESSKMSVAYNTVAENSEFHIQNKTFESFLFIGSLYKQKKIFTLIEAYHQLLKIDENILKLEIVGDGDEFDNIKNYIAEHSLEKNIILHGKITSDKELLPIMQRAVVCISPGQAGLSVQKCFSYGTGFITTKDAITGGEAFSIINNVNGNFYNGTTEDLTKVMLLYRDENYAKNISNNAYLFYKHYRNTDVWVKGFLENI
ncbi:glycosyltransferase [Acinetobacter sp. WA-87]|uniref:glycosyltransferase n=1 Tax=Acinetobacter sp. WA-87 TaxID=3153556 RepID=UPI003263107E